MVKIWTPDSRPVDWCVLCVLQMWPSGLPLVGRPSREWCLYSPGAQWGWALSLPRFCCPCGQLATLQTSLALPFEEAETWMAMDTLVSCALGPVHLRVPLSLSLAPDPSLHFHKVLGAVLGYCHQMAMSFHFGLLEQ